MPEVAVIIPTYNRPKAVKETLDSLEEMEAMIEYDVLVVDDSDNEQTKKVVQGHSASPKYIRPEESKNLPHARNVGIEEAETGIIAFVDDDVRFYDGWIDAIVSTFKDSGDIGAVGGPALEFENGEPKNHIMEENKNQNIVAEEGFITEKSTRWVPLEPVETDTLRGANMAFRKSSLEKVGGFDDGYIGNCFREDTDVCVRIKDAGYKIIYHPRAQLEHLYIEEGGTRDKSKEFWYSLGYNQRRFIEKNFSSHIRQHFARFFFTWSYSPYSLSKLFSSAMYNAEFKRFRLIKGFLGK